jgi:hypothetical protein
MMQETKIQLLPFEIELLSNADLILTKNAILQKLKHFLEEIQTKQQAFIHKNASSFPEEVIKISPKVSRGENYKGLPWLALDYPRHFEQENIFAIRTMFWWGNFFSTTLHISGKYKKGLQEKIISAYKQICKQDFYLCINANEWEHHVEESNYRKIKEIPLAEAEKIIMEKNFLKLAIITPIGPLSSAEELLCKNYEMLVSLCC